MSNWKERREASQEAVSRLFESDYAELYQKYEAKLNSDDLLEAHIAKEILLGHSNRDLDRLVAAKNEELRHIEWLPDFRVRVMWPFPMALTGAEFMILSYRENNQLFLTEKEWCFGFEVHDQDCFDFRHEYLRRIKWMNT